MKKNSFYKNILGVLFFALFLLNPADVRAGIFESIFGYSSYDDCILDKMAGVTSDVAAKQIKMACMQFNTKKVGEFKSCNQAFNLEDRKGVTGDARIIGEYIFIDFYNPNRILKITEIEVEVEGKNNNSKFTRNLTMTGYMPPLSSSRFDARLGLRNVTDWKVRINAVYGCSAN